MNAFYSEQTPPPHYPSFRSLHSSRMVDEVSPLSEKKKKLLVIEPGTKLLGRFTVVGEFGRGGFGDIYHVRDETQKTMRIMKSDTSEDGRRIKLEMMALCELRGKRHFPQIVACGTYKSKGYIIMQECGNNLADLRKEQPKRVFTEGTVLRVGEQMVAALLDMHTLGYLHRDIKPNNMCIGTIDKTRIYLIDLGLTRQFTTPNGEIRHPREIVGFRGTARYASLNAHYKKEQGPADDIISLVYTLVEMRVGNLPWGHLKSPEEVLPKKKEINMKTLCEKLPKPFRDMAHMVSSVPYEEFPDYDEIKKKLRACYCEGFDHNELYDWEIENPSEKKTKPDENKGALSKLKEMTAAKKETGISNLVSITPAEITFKVEGKKETKLTIKNLKDTPIVYRISCTKKFLGSVLPSPYGILKGHESTSVMLGLLKNEEGYSMGKKDGYYVSCVEMKNEKMTRDEAKKMVEDKKKESDRMHIPVHIS